MIRKHIIFYGRVQGVGFRYHCAIMAEQLGLTGWVRNLYDGTVEMEVQGNGVNISRLLHYLQDDRYIEITDMKAESMPVDKRESQFQTIY